MTAPALAAPYLASVALLGFAGLAKVARPQDTLRALRQTGLPATRVAVRLGAGAEVAIAGAALAEPGVVTATLVAATYAAFTTFILLALRMRWPISSCGCFGKPDSLPRNAHVLLNTGASVSAVGWAVARPVSLAQVFSGQPLYAAALGLVSAVVTLLAYLVWTDPLPAARQGGGG